MFQEANVWLQMREIRNQKDLAFNPVKLQVIPAEVYKVHSVGF
ncbi:MAG TPA: hypothetical protein VGP47_04815 [Parachlamydiaceae bacterium]|nr:hypothetical protein [Parachlamydiaceae bacterium]